MPSSLLFAGLVATWLAVLVPMAARRRQPMHRPTEAALSGRVLHRPRRRDQEVNPMDDARSDVEPTASPAPEPERHRSRHPRDLDPYRRAAPRRYDPVVPDYRKYLVRQRIALTLVLLAVTTGLLAAAGRLPAGWYAHLVLDLILIGYLTYLRRQALLERDRASWDRRPGDRSSPEPGRRDHLPDPRRRRRPGRPRTVAEEVAARAAAARRAAVAEASAPAEPAAEPTADHDPRDEAALPRLPPTQPLEQPAGTVVLELDDEDPDLHDLEWHRWRGYRRAAGQ